MLSIIYVNYKTSNDLMRSLASIVKYETKFNEYEIIIVDNNSDDGGLITIKEQYPFVTIINAPQNGGFAYGNNLGINHSNGDIVLLLNPDTYINDNSIELLTNRLENDPQIDIIGPQFFYEDGSSQTDIIPKSYLTLWKLFCEQSYLQRFFKHSIIFNSYLKTYLNPEKECFVECLSGAAFMFKRKIINIIGFMDESYFLFFEETDYCRRANNNNLKMLYYPISKITHTIGSSNKNSSKNRIDYFMKSFKFYFNKNYGHTALLIALTILFCGSLIRFCYYSIFDRNQNETFLYYLKSIMNRFS